MKRRAWRWCRAASIVVAACGAMLAVGCDSAGVPGHNSGTPTPGYITGRVIFNDVPVEGATIGVDEDYSLSGAVATAVTDMDGRYSIPTTPIYDAGYTDVVIWASHPDSGFSIPLHSETVFSEYQNIVSDFALLRVFRVTDPPMLATDVSLTPDITWESVPEAVAYSLDIFRRTPTTEMPNFFTWEKGYHDLTSTTFTVPSGDLKTGETYSIQIEAFNANGTLVGHAAEVTFDT